MTPKVPATLWEQLRRGETKPVAVQLVEPAIAKDDTKESQAVQTAKLSTQECKAAQANKGGAA